MEERREKNGANGASELAGVAPEGDVTRPTGGWSSQSRWLKGLLVLSLALVVLGVFRCSGELGPAETIEALKVSVDKVSVPAELLPVAPDSFAVVAAGIFGRTIEEETDVTVVYGEDESADALVSIAVVYSPNGFIGVQGVAVSTASGRRLAVVHSEGPAEMLEETVALSASGLVFDLELGPAQGKEAE